MIPSTGVFLRPAQPMDAALIFGWRNDPYIVVRSSSQSTVEWEAHQKWFTQALEAGDKKMFIIEIQGEPAGQVRFDRQGVRGAVITVYLLERFTGRGQGVEAIRRGCLAIQKEWSLDKIISCVREENTPGQRAFVKAGFQPESCGICPEQHQQYGFTIT